MLVIALRWIFQHLPESEPCKDAKKAESDTKSQNQIDYNVNRSN